MTAPSNPPAPPAPPPEQVPTQRPSPVDGAGPPDATPLRPRSGPPEVPVNLVMAARRGDPAAFARMIEHWNPHLRPFVHHVLAGDGSTDRALSAAYIRAYRALPRYDASQKPGLWLHRIAYLAATDELRRYTRDPIHRRNLADQGRAETATDAVRDHLGLSPDDIDELVLSGDPTAAPTADADLEIEVEDDSPEESDLADESAVVEARAIMALDEDGRRALIPPGWRRLAPDQRALAVLVDLEGYRLTDASAALDAHPVEAAARLESARRLLCRLQGVTVPTGPLDSHPETLRTAHDTLAAMEVPPADQRFWSVLGRRLLAEREAPAAAAINPRERLARLHPAEPGFKPRASDHSSPDVARRRVHQLAEQADVATPGDTGRRRPRAVIALVVTAVAALVVAAVLIGTSSRIPDGSRPASEVATDTAAAMAAGPFQKVTANVSETAPGGRTSVRSYEIVLGSDGSWAVSTNGTIDQTTYDATNGLLRRVAVVGEGERAQVYATDSPGLAAGAPDSAPTQPTPLDDLTAVPTLLRAADQTRMPRRKIGDTPVRTLTRSLPTGVEGATEQWQVSISTSTSLPVEIVRSRDGRVVRRVSVEKWESTTSVPATTFAQPVPDGVEAAVDDSGFASTDMAAVPLLGRGEPVTPSWLPPGFELSVVAVRSEAPSGRPSTSAGSNPADIGVMSLGYQYGVQRIVVSSRAAGSDPTAWSSPFAPVPRGDPAQARVLGDGRYNGARVTMDVDARGRTRLWGISGDTVFTVAGDLTPDQAYRVAASFR